MRDLVLSELTPYRNDANAVRLSGDDVQVEPHMLTALGMLVHELTTNAVKYGALSIAGGQVDVSWQTDFPASVGRLRLCWTESGGPAITQSPTHMGMGSRLLQVISADLGGAADLQYEPTGVSCAIELPWKNAERYR